ncbi:MAG: cell wall metabolism sensor histidine kinase WalK [Actinobacteria bacterium]|nr:cell wall metabolism sensor histidine kinase WalK [Actinomycetota bacterium]
MVASTNRIGSPSHRIGSRVNRIGLRLLAAFILFVVLLVLALSLASGLILRGVFLQNLDHDLADRARVVAVMLTGETEPLSPSMEDLEALQALVEESGAAADARITVIASDGTVLADSHDDPTHMENHADRPEVIVALAGGEGHSRRLSATAGKDTVYVAIPLDQDTGPLAGGVVRVAAAAERVDPLLEQVFRVPLFVGLFALIPTILAALLISRSLTRPIERLHAMAEAVASGDLSHRVATPRRTDELGDLARALNTMAGELDKRVTELRAEQERMADILSSMGDGVLLLDDRGVVLDVNPACARMIGAPLEGMRGQPLVRVARVFPAQPLIDEAVTGCRPFVRRIELPGDRTLSVQVVPLARPDHDCQEVLMVIHDETEGTRVERLRKDFVNNVSHELKTPLAGLALLAGTLGTAIEDDPPSARIFAGRLNAEIARLTELVTDLLALSELDESRDSGRLSLQPVDLAEIAQGIVDTLAERARALDLDLSLDVTGPAMVEGDPTALATMTRNLVDNALRYTDPGGRVEVVVDAGAASRAATAGDASRAATAGDVADLVVRLLVRDDGIGIPRDSRDRIFERFYRVDKARSRDTGGTGLGLSIVKNTAEAHGGTVAVESAVGLGSTFTVTLPKRPAERPPT